MNALARIRNGYTGPNNRRKRGRERDKNVVKYRNVGESITRFIAPSCTVSCTRGSNEVVA
jgi:hypothetical protein